MSICGAAGLQSSLVQPSSVVAGLYEQNPWKGQFCTPRPGAIGPVSGRRMRRRRYADAPAAALLTGLGAGEWSPLRSGPYASFGREELHHRAGGSAAAPTYWLPATSQ